MPGRATKILSISVPEDMYVEIEEMAREERRTKSELIREAVREYRFNRRWRLIRRWGEETALRTDIHTDEDIEERAG